MIVGIDNITPGTSTSSSLSVGSMRPYIQDLLLGLPALFPQWRFKFFTPSWNEPFEIRDRNVETIVCPGASRSRIKRVWFEQMKLPRLIAAEKVDVWLGTCNYLPLLARCRTLLIVQSHQFFTNPDAFHPVRRLFLKWIVTRSVRLADRTGVQCEDAKRTLLRYVRVPEDSVCVIYNRMAEITAQGPPDAAPKTGGTHPSSRDSAARTCACSSEDAQVVALPPRPYLLYVSAFYRFKNHPRLIEAFARIRPHFPGLSLVLAGGNADGRTANQLREIAAGLGVANDVILPGNVPRSALPALYRNARASVFLSLEETFGLPVLEAMAFACPVLTSDRSSMAEIAGDAALLADPRNVDSIAAGLREVLTNETLRSELKRKGSTRCARFTKEGTIRSVAEALEAVAA